MAMQPQTQSPMVLMSYSPPPLATRPQSPMVRMSYSPQDYRMVRVTPPPGGQVTIGLDFACHGPTTGQAPVIDRVHVGSPAYDAGLLKGDRILSVSATNMTTTTDVIGFYSDQLSLLLKQTFHTSTMAGGRMIVEVERFGAVFFVELGPVWSSSVISLSLSLAASRSRSLSSSKSLSISSLAVTLSRSLSVCLSLSLSLSLSP
jgi:hypothetical protein